MNVITERFYRLIGYCACNFVQKDIISYCHESKLLKYKNVTLFSSHSGTRDVTLFVSEGNDVVIRENCLNLTDNNGTILLRQTVTRF